MFDDQKVVATIGAVHRGVTSKSDIGFLSVDPEESKLIGDNLNRPRWDNTQMTVHRGHHKFLYSVLAYWEMVS